jgi:predicted amino acid dehydrogenase
MRKFQRELLGVTDNVQVDVDLERLQDCNVIVSASGAFQAVLDGAPFAPGTLICDVAKPPDVSAEVRRRSDLTVFDGGLVALPDPTLRFGMGNLLGYPSGVQLACFAETMLLGLEGVTRDVGIGDDIPLTDVDFVMGLARRHGFEVACLLDEKWGPPKTHAADFESRRSVVLT